MKNIHHLFLGLLMFSACSGLIQAQGLLSPAEFAKKIKESSQVQLLDVRTPQEFASGHIESAKNINYYDLNFRSQVGSLDKNKPLYVYCQSGIRSAKAVSILKSMGFKQIYDMEGGFGAWLRQGLKSVK